MRPTAAASLVTLALLTTLALAGCGDDAAGAGDPSPVTTDPTSDPTVTPADDSLPADAFLRVSGTMTDSTGVSLHVVLTVNEPQTAASLPEVDSALAACPFYAGTRAENDGLGDEPYLSTATLTVTGDDAPWNQEHLVYVSTGGDWSVGTGSATVFDSTDTCVSDILGAGTSSFVTYYPTLEFEGGIEGALTWGTFGFGDQGDGGGVIYTDCSVELGAHADALSPGDPNWILRDPVALRGCFIAPENNDYHS